MGAAPHRHRLRVPAGRLADGHLVQNAFADGLASFQAAFSDPDVVHALIVTIEISLWAVAINTVFGVGMALLLVRYEFPGKRALSALIDLPMSVSPVVIGLALLLVYNGRNGWFGPTLESHGLMVIFNSPGMIMATCFVSLPLVVREVVPVLDRDRRRPGAGGHEPRRQRLPDPSPDHPARPSSGPSSTASCSPSPARSASSAPSRSSPAT